MNQVVQDRTSKAIFNYFLLASNRKGKEKINYSYENTSLQGDFKKEGMENKNQ